MLRLVDRLPHRPGPGQWEQSAAHLVRLLRPGALYMLYAWLPRRWKGRTVGIATAQVDALLTAAFKQERIVLGQERGLGSAWYWYRRK